MDPLDRLLRPLAAMINRQVTAKTPARELCRELAGKTVAVRVRDTGLAMYFHIETDGVTLSVDSTSEPNVAITGSLLSLAGLATRGESALRNGTLDFTGDVYTAQAFQKLLAYGRPDMEEELASVVGDAAARGIGDFVRGVGRWAGDARSTMRQNVSEYLTEESGAVPNRVEAEAFRDDVNVLRDDVDRLEARLSRLEAASAGSPAE